MNEPTAESDLVDEPPANQAAAGFSSLYAENSRARFIIWRCGIWSNPQKAEDATHDVFLKAFKKLDQYRGEASLRTWLYRIAINHCQNLRQVWQERHVYSNADDAVWDGAAAKTDSPLRVLETKELGQRIQQALDALPDEYRLLLLLVADEELSYEQIGALVGQSDLTAVRGKLHRGAQSLRGRVRETA